MKFLEGVKPIKFDEEKHKYYTDKGKELISVSTLVKLYAPVFDEDGSILLRSAQKRGITPEELQKEWTDEKDKACIRGTQLHKEIEHWVDTGKINKKGEFVDAVKQIKKIKFKGELKSEVVLYSEKKYNIAGTCDLLDIYNDNQIDLYDAKSNKALKFKSFFNRENGYSMMLYPISHLMNCNTVHYYLQLAIYSLLLEEFGYWVNKATLLYLNPKTGQIEPHEIQYLRKEALDIIKHYNSVLA